MSLDHAVPQYFDALIEGFGRGETGRDVHLGHWDTAPRWLSDDDIPPDEFRRAQGRLTEIMIEMAECRPGQAVLDVGCGFGGALERINADFAGMTLAGINIDRRQLDVCRSLARRGDNRLHWIQADACRLPVAAGSVDRVLCIEAMFHFPCRRRFFREAARALRAGGILVVSDILLIAATDSAADGAVRSAIQSAYGPWPDLWGADADHEALARAAGLRLTVRRNATENTRPSHRFTSPSDGETRPDAGSPMIEAALALRRLHEQGRLRYLYMRFEKPARI